MRHHTGLRLSALAASAALAMLTLAGGPALGQITAAKLDARVVTGPTTGYVAVTVGNTPSVLFPGPAAQAPAANQDGQLPVLQDQYENLPSLTNWEDGTMLATDLADPSFAGIPTAPAGPAQPGQNCRLVNITFAATDMKGKAAKSPVKVVGEPSPTTCIPLGITWKVSLAVSEVTTPAYVAMTVTDVTLKKPFAVLSMALMPINFTLTCSPASIKQGGAGKGTITLTQKSAAAKTVLLKPNPAVQMPAAVTIKAGTLSADFAFKAPPGQRLPPTIAAAANWTSFKPKECTPAPGS